MANPSVLTADATLYCPAEPEGRMFPAGSEWPGDAWTADRGGEPVGKKATAQAVKDLVAAQDKLDALSAQLDTATHSLALRAGERDEAVNKLADAEQRAIAAAEAQKTAEDAAKGYMTERDAARADAKRFSDAVDGYRPEAEKVPDLVEQLADAEQRAADLQTQLDAANAAPKPKKAAKDNAAAGDDVTGGADPT